MNIVNFYKRFINKFNSIVAYFHNILKKSKFFGLKTLNLCQRQRKVLTI